MLGAAWIAGRAMLPALQAARNAIPLAMAGRDPTRAAVMAKEHGVARVHPTYEALLDDPDVDAVYIALVNNLHREWTLRALAHGKHVLCEKPLGLTAAEAVEMADAAAVTRLTLMEGFMYRFHPRMLAMRERATEIHFLHAGFSFPLTDPANYRLRPELGGGALLDVGCYTLDIARWFLGEPSTVSAALHGGDVDTSMIALLGFADGMVSTGWASFDAPEYQQLVVAGPRGLHRVQQPFTAWHDPHDPYQLMVEAFSDAVLGGTAAPRSLADSIATAELIDRVRAAAAR